MASTTRVAPEGCWRCGREDGKLNPRASLLTPRESTLRRVEHRQLSEDSVGHIYFPSLRDQQAVFLRGPCLINFRPSALSVANSSPSQACRSSQASGPVMGILRVLWLETVPLCCPGHTHPSHNLAQPTETRTPGSRTEET